MPKSWTAPSPHAAASLLRNGSGLAAEHFCMRCCRKTPPSSPATRCTAGNARSARRPCWALWARAGLGQQMDASMKMFEGRRGGHHAAGVHGAGLAGGPHQRLAAAKAGMNTQRRFSAATRHANALPGLLVRSRWCAGAGGPEFLVAGPAVGAVCVRPGAGQDGPVSGRAAAARNQPGVLQNCCGPTLETLAMSALGTLLAVLLGLALALPASKALRSDPARWRGLRGCCSTPCAAFPNWCGPRCC